MAFNKKPTYKELEAENKTLRDTVEALLARIATLEKKVEELSRKSQRPHAPFSKGKPKKKPMKNGRKPGEAYGQKKHREPPPQIDEVHRAKLPLSCPNCQSRKIQKTRLEEQFQAEIPREVIYRKFQIEIGECSCCGNRVQGRHPLQTSNALGAAASQLGAEAQALVTYLGKHGGLSHGKIVDLLKRVFGISLSRGGSAQIMLRAAERCGDQYKQALAEVKESAVVYPDETGWKVGGLLQWLWTFVTPEATLYAIRPSRGFDVPEEILGADYKGIIGHDGWSPYNRFKEAKHQQCHAHLFRRCASLLEAAQGGAARFPLAIKGLLKEGLALRDQLQAQQISLRGFSIAVGKLKAKLIRLISADFSHEGNACFARFLFRHREQIFTYLENDVEATNHLAEQAIRPAVVNRKVWGGSRTKNGAQAQSVLMTTIANWNRAGMDCIQELSNLIRRHPALC